ncbi:MULTISPECIES: hypothetical protein [Micrococcaceae]|uniref:hypothetical protein n=1 Tax=Micrococcaceae TaxID=1268 RepID=UPI000701F8A5|nr:MULTISPECIES: hypothetical protein [unclassified Arthrobacter]KRE65935.1 hypothetical protein ASG79_12595 [Arthrobacter sp. Soil761]TWD53921.1 hypothetical protein FB478_103340 [Arthrobacter sp. AG367]
MVSVPVIDLEFSAHDFTWRPLDSAVEPAKDGIARNRFLPGAAFRGGALAMPGHFAASVTTHL